MRIRRKIVFNMLLAALLPLTVTMSVLLWHSSQQAHKFAIDQARGELNAAREKLSSYFALRATEISLYSETPLLKEMKFPKINSLLSNRLQRNSNIYQEFILATPSGNFYSTADDGNPAYSGLNSFNDSDPDARLQTLEQHDYWQATVGQNRDRNNITVISDPMISHTAGTKQVVVASTIRAKNGDVVGMIGGALPWKEIQTYLTKVSNEINTELKWDANLRLITDNNKAPFSEMDEKKIIKGSNLDETDNIFSAGGEKILAGLAEYSHFKDPLSNESYALFYAPLNISNYAIALTIPEAQLMAPVATLRTYFYTAFALATLFIIAVSWFFSNRLTAPIISLNSAAREVHQGERHPLVLPSGGDDEISDLTRSFNNMITALIDKDEHLKLNEERFTLAMMGSNDGVFDWNFNTGQHFFSPRCQIILGERDDDPDITMETWLAHIHPQEQQWINEQLHNFINGKRKIYNLEYRIRHKDGEYRHILSRAFAVRDPENHLAKRIVGTITDITQTKKHQQKFEQLKHQFEQRINDRTQALTASNHLLMEEIRERKETENSLQHHRTLLQKTEYLAHVGGWEINVNNLQLHWTEESFRIHELPRSAQIDFDTSINFFEKEQRHLIQDAIQQAIYFGKAFDLELPLITAKAKRIWVRTIGEPVIENDKITRVIGSLQDISELKELERMKNDFVSTVSHELRTPLTAIHGSIKLLLNNVVCELPESAKSMLGIAEKNSQRLLTLINDLLDMDKISSGKMSFEFKHHDINTLISESINLNQTYADRFGVIITLKNPIPDCTIMVDSTRFMQVMSNLLSNAAKFSPMESEIIIRVETTPKEKILISVQDFGNGIPDDFKEKIFTQFSQAGNADMQKVASTGLGLNISRAIIEKMRGTIGFESQKGEGSTFYFELPANSKRTSNACDNTVEESTHT